MTVVTTRWTMPLINRGLHLRAKGLTYSAIAVVYREYHSFWVTDSQVRAMLRKHGAAPHPRGGLANLRRGPA